MSKPLPPIELPWTMKPLESAETKVETLDDGRTRYSIRHEILAGVTPEMLVWWLNNMDGTWRIGDVELPRYRIWHPRDHVALRYVRAGHDGRNFSAGARIHIREFFNADPRYAVDVIDDVEHLDETGFRHTHSKLGVRVAEMNYTFNRVPEGTRYENSLTVGVGGSFPLHGLLNAVIRTWVFPEHQGRAWLRHNVEEVGNFQFYLPALYAAQGQR